MIAYILSDGSFDPNLRIGTCAYSIVVNGETYRDTARVADISGSAECEMFGIYCAIRALRKKLKEIGHDERLEMLHIFSDSDESFRVLETLPKNFETRMRYEQWRDRIESNLQSITLKRTRHIIKGHVNSAQAKPIEQRHNEIDKLSNEELKQFRESLLHVDNQNSKICGVAINGHCKKGDEKPMYQIGYQIAHEGYEARIYAGANSTDLVSLGSHPFIQGMNDYFKKKGVNPESKMHLLPHYKLDPSDFHSGCAGLDGALALPALGIQKTSKFDAYRPTSIRAASFSRLIFGLQNPVGPKTKPESAEYGRLERGSEFILNLSSDPINKSMLKNIRELVDIPVYHDALSLKVELNSARQERESSCLSI